MKVSVELLAGPNHRHAVCQEDMQKNIDSLQRCIDGRKTGADDTLLMDTISILTAIQKQLSR